MPRHLTTGTDRLNTLKHILSWSIWSLVALYALIMTAIHVPAIQGYIGSKVASAVSQKLGTTVSVGRVDLGFLNRIIIDDVLIRDQQQQDMLRVGRMSVRLEIIPLVKGRVVISSAQLFGAHVHLYKSNRQAPFNFQFALDSLASKDTTSHTPLDLRINSLIVRHSSISYDCQDQVQKHEQLDYNHLLFNNISAHVSLKNLTNDSLSINLKRLAFQEHSGLAVNRLSFRLDAGVHGARIENVALHLPHSQLSIDSLVTVYDTAQFKRTIRYAGSINSPGIAVSDLASLYSILKNYENILTLNAVFTGTANSINISTLDIATKDHEIQLQAQGWAKHLDGQPTWHIGINNLWLSEKILSTLQHDIDNMPEQLTRLGDLRLMGFFDGSENGEMKTTSILGTKAGDVNLRFVMQKDRSFTGHVATDGIDLKQLLDHEDFGTLITTVDISGDRSKLNVEGVVSKLDYKNYPYHNIELNGSYQQGNIAGKLKIDDPNIQTDVEGELRQKDKQAMALRMTGYIRNLSPLTLNLTHQWGEATFSAVVDADITASTLNDAEGTIDLDDFILTDSTGIFRLDNIHLRSGYNNDKHFLRLSGDMGEAELRGQFDWNTLPRSFVNYISSKLPTLPGLPQKHIPSVNDFDISLRLINTEWLERIFKVPLRLEKPLLLEASINDLAHDLSIDGTIPSFTYGGSHYRNANVHLTTPSDTMKCDIALTKIMDNNTQMDLSLTASASDNKLLTNIGWNNRSPKGDGWQGQLNTLAELYDNESGKPEAHIHVLPSNTIVGDAEWIIQPSDIVYSEANLLVDHFSIEHENQHLTIDGIASKHKTDTLVVDLKEMGVDYVLGLVNFHSVEFGGKASGKAYVTQLFDKPDAWANLTVDDFLFENGRMGTLYANADWDNDKGQIDISATADDGLDAMTYVEGYVSIAREYIDLDIHANGTYIDFMNSFTSSFLSDATGHGYGQVKLAGPLSTINLTGQLVVDGQATVTALGTTYTLKKDTVAFIPDDIRLDSIPVYDRLGQVAYLSGGIHHEHLTHLTFDLDVATDRLLAYEFQDFGDDIFYGTVFAQGNVDLHGRPGEVIINCNATPLQGTTFTYNAVSTDAISQQEFITWGEREPAAIAASSESKEAHTDHSSDKTPDALDNQEGPTTDIRMNFLINTLPEAEMRLLMDEKTADYITLHGSGVIRASYYNKGAFHMFGTYTVADGTYGITIQNIIKKNFQFQPNGTIVFGGNPMDANLNLQARYTVNGVSLSDLSIGNSFNNTVRVECLMNILGQAGAPRVEFDFDLPTVNSEEKQMIRSLISSEQETNQQVLYLLGIGRFYTQGANNANPDQQYGQTQLAMQSFLSGTLSTQINEVISQVVKTNDWNFGANISTGNEGWHNAEYEGIVSGRMLNNRLLINGQFGYRDNATQATPSFIGDFDLRYLLYPNGNLALKVYNQTNDRYFTHSSLNTQGIGLIMKRDFNGLPDLFSTLRKKKKSK